MGSPERYVDGVDCVQSLEFKVFGLGFQVPIKDLWGTRTPMRLNSRTVGILVAGLRVEF